MLKNIAVGIALIMTMWMEPLAAQSEAPVIRTKAGLRYVIPAGWEWTLFDGHRVTIQHTGTKSGEKGKEVSPNQFEIGGRYSPDDYFDQGWGQLDRTGQRRLPNGVTARWKAGMRWNAHYVFAGEATVGSKVLSVSKLASKNKDIDDGLIEAAFLSIVETLRDVPESAVIYHPSLRIAADALKSKSWFSEFSGHNIAFGCWSNQDGCGKGSNTWIYIYPSSVAFADTVKALADITGYYEKNDGLKIGEIRRVDFPGGEFLWTEQPRSSRPFLGAVRRDDRYFFISMYAGTSVTLPNDAVRDDFLAAAKNVRAWDGN